MLYDIAKDAASKISEWIGKIPVKSGLIALSAFTALSVVSLGYATHQISAYAGNTEHTLATHMEVQQSEYAALRQQLTEMERYNREQWEHQRAENRDLQMRIDNMILQSKRGQ